MLIKEDQGYVIVTNDKHHFKRRAFTAAHEMSHYYLHLPLMGRFICNDLFKVRNNAMEAEANSLAAELLMPESIYANKLREYKANFRLIANFFGISEEAARWRYVNLCQQYTPIPKQKLLEYIIRPYKEELENKYGKQNYFSAK